MSNNDDEIYGCGCLLFMLMIVILFFSTISEIKDAIIDIMKASNETRVNYIVCPTCGSTNTVIKVESGK